MKRLLSFLVMGATLSLQGVTQKENCLRTSDIERIKKECSEGLVCKKETITEGPTFFYKVSVPKRGDRPITDQPTHCLIFTSEEYATLKALLDPIKSSESNMLLSTILKNRRAVASQKIKRPAAEEKRLRDEIMLLDAIVQKGSFITVETFFNNVEMIKG